jgi:dethiobiotin synthetase
MRPIFITGIGTSVGKTLVSAILVEALQADYWKPVQTGSTEGTDGEGIKKMVSSSSVRIHPELFILRKAASPHIAAREEGVRIGLDQIVRGYESIRGSSGPGMGRWLIIEGAGGIMVPLNEEEFMIDLIPRMGIPVVLVSRNYLGSINHSLLTASVGRSKGLDILGWVFNDQTLGYEKEIVKWTGIPQLACIPYSDRPDQQFVRQQAELIRPILMNRL